MFQLITIFVCFIASIWGTLITSVPTPSKQLFAQSLFWDKVTLSFYFVDILTPYLYRYSYVDNRVYNLTVDGISSPGLFMPIKDSTDEYIVSMNDTIFAIKWNGRSDKGKLLRKVVSAGRNDIHLHSTYVGSNGAMYVGSYGNDHCAGREIQPLYRYTKRGGLIQFAEDFVAVVGFAFDAASNTLYSADGCTKRITAFHLNPENNRLSNEHVVITLGEHDDFGPAGLTIDRKGFLYVSMYNGTNVLKIDTRKQKVIEKIPMPVPTITSIQFGGPKNDILFVLSANAEINFSAGGIGKIHTDPPYGNLFMIHGLCEGGTPSYRPDA